MQDFKFQAYLPIEKVDDEQRMVYGWASTPDLDSDGEIISLDAIKNALPNYMKFPTIREMHQAKAAGTTKNASVHTTKGLYIGAKIVADDAWNLVKEGVYKGFSIGGHVVQKVGNVIKELELVEISLVDVPANKAAKIEVWKSDKRTEKIALALWKGVKHNMQKNAEETKKDNVEAVDTAALNADEAKVAEETVAKADKADDKKVEPVKTDEVATENDSAKSEDTSKEEVSEETVVSEEKKESEEDKNASDNPALKKIEEANKVLEKVSGEKVSTEKLDLTKTVNAIASTVAKMAMEIAKMDEEIKKLGNSPAATKSKAAFVVKGQDAEDKKEDKDASKLEVKKARLAELNKAFDDLGPAKFAKEGLSLEASKLQDEIAQLEQKAV